MAQVMAAKGMLCLMIKPLADQHSHYVNITEHEKTHTVDTNCKTYNDHPKICDPTGNFITGIW